MNELTNDPFMADWNKTEWDKAVALYKSIRDDDERLATIEGRAVNFIRQCTAYEPLDVGSFGLMLNIPGSDLDLSMGVDDNDVDRVQKILSNQGLKFKGERITRPNTVRYVFAMSLENVEIDIAVLKREDFQLIIRGLEQCRRELTERERIIHVYKKLVLKRQGNKETYAKFKLASYIKYCPGFCWVPIVEGV